MKKNISLMLAICAICIFPLSEMSFGGESTSKKIADGFDGAFEYMDDSGITTKVKSALLAQKNIKSTNLSVSTSKGVVTITGTARNITEKELIVSTVLDVKGVNAVSAGGLDIKDDGSQSADEYASDTAITTEVKGRMVFDNVGSLKDVTVETKNGIVSLYGVVDNEKGYNAAQKIAIEVKGVKGVKNYIKIRE